MSTNTSTLDFYLKVVGAMALTELIDWVNINGNGNIDSPSVLETMRHNAEAIAEQNLARLLMEVHRLEEFDIFKLKPESAAF